MTTPFSFSQYLAAHARLADALDVQAFEVGIGLISATFERGNQIITCGNGGSAHTASHYITDWNKAITQAAGKRFRGASLCDNSGIVILRKRCHLFAPSMAAASSRSPGMFCKPAR